MKKKENISIGTPVVALTGRVKGRVGTVTGIREGGRVDVRYLDGTTSDNARALKFSER